MKHFPREIEALMRINPKAMFLEIAACGPNDCANCGGNGRMYAFDVSGGPYMSASGLRSDGKVSKWADNRWWVGNTVSYVCPDCLGMGCVVEKMRQEVLA